MPEAEIDWLGLVHLGSALLAMASGAAVLMMEKGHTAHRRMGWVYVGSMVVVNGTAFMIYELFGRFGPFHIAALLSGLTVVLGMIPAIRRRPRKRWIGHHATWMTGSYVGLMAAAASETSTRYLRYDFGLSVILATAVVVVIGVIWMRRTLPRILRQYGL